MNKKAFGFFAAALLVSMGLAACDTNTAKTSVTTGPATQWSASAADFQGSTLKSTAPGEPLSSTTKAKTTAPSTKAPPSAPELPLKQENAASSTQAFTSLSQLQTLAGRFQNTGSGYGMMRENVLILPKAGFLPHSPSDKDYQGSFNDQVLNFGFNASLDGAPLDVTYSILQKAYPSRNIRDCIKSSVVNRCIPVSAGGTTYYYDTGSVDGRDILSVYYFYESYCVTAVFYDPPMGSDGSVFLSALESRGFLTMAKKSLS